MKKRVVHEFTCDICETVFHHHNDCRDHDTWCRKQQEARDHAAETTRLEQEACQHSWEYSLDDDLSRLSRDCGQCFKDEHISLMIRPLEDDTTDEAEWARWWDHLNGFKGSTEQ